MTLHVYDSAARAVREFVPITPGRVGLYVCGATPQSSPHIGHMRAAVNFDVLARWLTRSGYEVTYVRNVTDVDDKILAKARDAGRPWWAHAYLFEQEFTRAYDSLNVARPTYEPHATAHVTDMVELIGRLVDAGHAYATGGGDVWFDVPSFPQYGALTRQGGAAGSEAGDEIGDGEGAGDGDGAAGGKRDPRDFALWKGVKPEEPPTASWDTPWGRGRPGWHLECSAMATRYLGAEFDIHGGGLDLRFPHHENELAQARAAGDPFARYWMHNAWVVQAGEKMSKSLGNTMGMAALTAQVPAVVVRYLLAAPHYRSNIEIGPGSLEEARTAYARVEGFVRRAAEADAAQVRGTAAGTPVPQAFRTAMDDDLATPAALAVLHETVRSGNAALADGRTGDAVRAALEVRSMADVLGVDPFDPHWAADAPAGDDRAARALDVLVRDALDARAQARKERDFAAADAVRDRLTAAGIAVEDTAQGARWTLAEPVAPHPETASPTTLEN